MSETVKARGVWGVKEFAEHVGLQRMAATRHLLQLDRKHGGRLLLPRATTKEPLRFKRSTLKRLEPELFDEVKSVEWRLAELEEQLAETTERLRFAEMQARDNARGLSRVGHLVIHGRMKDER